VVLQGTAEPPVRYHPWVLEDLTAGPYIRARDIVSRSVLLGRYPPKE
jgi:hypothetical protein